MSRVIIITVFLAAGLLWSWYGMCGEIHDACARGEVVKVEALIDDNPGLVNSPGAGGRTPLFYALDNGHGDAAMLLLRRGADGRAANPRGVTPLQMAAAKGMDDVAASLIELGADVNAADQDGLTPLWMAIMGGNGKSGRRTARLLVGKGALVDAKTRGGATPLHAAVLSGDQDLIEILVSDCADMYAEGEVMVGMTTLEGVTPIGLAAYLGRKTAAEIFLDGEADLSAADSRGRTPVHLAALGSSGKAMIERLVAEGTPADARDKEGRTALHYLVTGFSGEADPEVYREIARELTAKGVRIYEPDNQGVTAPGLAKSLGKDRMAETLVSLGKEAGSN